MQSGSKDNHSHENLHSIRLDQIKYLLEIYHGKKSLDLSSAVSVDASRTKGLIRKYIPFFSSSSVVTHIENLVKEMELAGVKTDEAIPEHYQCKLIPIVKLGEQEREGSATQLLYHAC
jgi:hypothetical protein